MEIPKYSFTKHKRENKEYNFNMETKLRILNTQLCSLIRGIEQLQYFQWDKLMEETIKDMDWNVKTCTQQILEIREDLGFIKRHGEWGWEVE